MLSNASLSYLDPAGSKLRHNHLLLPSWQEGHYFQRPWRLHTHRNLQQGSLSIPQTISILLSQSTHHTTNQFNQLTPPPSVKLISILSIPSNVTPPPTFINNHLDYWNCKLTTIIVWRREWKWFWWHRQWNGVRDSHIWEKRKRSLAAMVVTIFVEVANLG